MHDHFEGCIEIANPMKLCPEGFSNVNASLKMIVQSVVFLHGLLNRQRQKSLKFGNGLKTESCIMGVKERYDNYQYKSGSTRIVNPQSLLFLSPWQNYQNRPKYM